MIINNDILNWCEVYAGERFHAVLCDPPYELGFMGKSWDKSGIAFDPNTWKAISKHLYPGAYLMAFGGTRTYHRIAVAIEDAGFEIRDTMMWVYGSGFPKSLDVSKAIDKAAGAEREVVGEKEVTSKFDDHDGSMMSVENSGGKNRAFTVDITVPSTVPAKQWSGYGTALKPAWEPIIIARLPIEGTVAQNAQKYGSGALNIDGCRVAHQSESDRASATPQGKVIRNNFAPGEDIEGKETSRPDTSLGRWPANLIHDGSDEVAGMFPNESARFFYSAKVSKSERDAGLGDMPETILARSGGAQGAESRGEEYEEGQGIGINKVHRVRNNHPTLKPISLTTYLAKLILPPKLDTPRRLLVPFAGSGSEVIGGYLAGWDEVLGVEREKEYVEIAEARIKHWTKSSPQPSSSSTSVPPESTDGQEILDI